MEADLFLTETWKETIFRKCGQWQSDLKGRGTPQREEVQELTFYKTDMSQETEEGKRRNKTTWGHESCFSIYITTEEVWLQQTRTAGTDQSGPPNATISSHYNSYLLWLVLLILVIFVSVILVVFQDTEIILLVIRAEVHRKKSLKLKLIV